VGRLLPCSDDTGKEAGVARVGLRPLPRPTRSPATDWILSAPRDVYLSTVYESEVIPVMRTTANGAGG
jgi:hypothetical protein